jgi:cytochrome c biogenesis protein CcmG/thiol:disulfide interchange protein DsbE
MKLALLPLAGLIVLLGFLGAGLQRDPRAVPSPLMGQAVPSFRLPVLAAPDQMVTPEQLRGQVWVLNVWASWCVACRLEHPVVKDLAGAAGVPLYGLNYKDAPADAMRWLGLHGNPYLKSLSDLDGRAGIEFGVYGVPETYVIDRQGLIQYKHTGALTPELLRDTLLPLIGRLRA